MGIQPGDARYYKSERMHDFSDGGGRQTNTELPSGVQNELFPILSRLDVTYGRVNLRKIYAAVRSAITDTYFGAHSIITAPPANERVSCVLFSTGSDFDTRDAARDRIESYVVAGPLSRLRLYGRQVVGQQAILCYQRVEEPLPDIGDVLVLSVEAAGYTPAQQFVRITDLAHEERTFTDEAGEFQRRVLTLKLGSTLNQTFEAGEVSRYSEDTNITKLRSTLVADASRYYGIQPLAEPASAGALDLRVASVYSALVPSTQRETAVSLAQIAGYAHPAAISPQHTVIPLSHAIPESPTRTTLYVGREISPGSARLQYTWSTYNFMTFTAEDNGDGTMSIVSGGGAYDIRVDYQAGTISYVRASEGALTALGSLSFAASTGVQGPAHTRQIPVTLGTRGTVYAETLHPLPAPGTLIVDFRALGRWYRLRDNGAGELVANDPNEGTGSIDYVTGALIVTLGALPDVDSAILLAWGSPAHYTVRAGDTAITPPVIRHTTEHPIQPGSLTITWLAGGVEKSATATVNGTISGDATGRVAHGTGEIALQPAQVPDPNSLVVFEYQQATASDETIAPTVDGSGLATFALTDTPIRPGSVTLTWSVLRKRTVGEGGVAEYSAAASASDDGAGTLLRGTTPVGTVNYTTGAVTLQLTQSYSYSAWKAMAGWGFRRWETVTETDRLASPPSVRARYHEDSTVFTAHSESVQAPPLTLDLTPLVVDTVVPGSVLFTWAGHAYIDRAGQIYRDLDLYTGSAIPAGTIDYSSGMVTLTDWVSGANSVSVDALLTTFGGWTAIDAFFRTAGSPLRPASLYVQVTTATGELITGTSDQNGVITGAKMRGAVEQTMGVVEVEFGERVLDSSLTPEEKLEEWYDPADVDAEGYIWRPLAVMPGTLRYNCVVISNLPLAPAILGLDPVRLPADGRVPIFRPGDVVVVHHTQETVVASPQPSTTYSVGRTNVAVIEVLDANGDPLAATAYLADLGAGTVTMAADYSGAGAITIRDRIEHMTVLADVQINGQVALSSPLPHDYPAGAYVSGALLHADLLARATAVFDQATWTGVWSDERIGSDAAAAYNDLAYPVEVNAQGTVRERWRLNFTGTTTFQIIGEQVGIIGTGTTGADVAPINGATGQPYFVLRAAGFGSGWSAGNQIRFNTFGPSAPVWVARTTLAGAALVGDAFGLEIRGDVA